MDYVRHPAFHTLNTGPFRSFAQCRMQNSTPDAEPWTAGKGTVGTLAVVSVADTGKWERGLGMYVQSLKGADRSGHQSFTAGFVDDPWFGLDNYDGQAVLCGMQCRRQSAWTASCHNHVYLCAQLRPP
ncbi:MAG: hypothetical protein ACJAZO_001434 [Myxococcota bacterium]